MSKTIAALLDEAEALLARGQHPRSHQLCLEALHADQGSARAWRLMASLAAAQGEVDQAAECLTRAAALEPSQARNHGQLAICLARLHRRAEARLAIERALACPACDLVALDAIGAALSLLDDLEGAREVFRRAAEEPGVDPNTIRNLGVAHQAMGDFAAAEACYRQALALDPRLHRAWYGLVRLKRQTPEDNVLAELEHEMQRAVEAEAVLDLGHALAKSLEDLGDYDGALRWLARAKARPRAGLPYDRQADARLFALAGDLAETPSIAAGRALEAAPIFVVGMPRSGTTLVERILASHSQVKSVGESNALAFTIKRVTAVNGSISVNPQTLLAARAADTRTIGQGYIGEVAAAGSRIVDKMPSNLFYVGVIRKALPNARIVCLQRDPLDTCLSNYTQLFAQDPAHHAYNFDMAATAQRFVHFAGLTRRLRATLPGNRYMELSYERLVASPERETRRLLDFCGLAWEEACLRFHEAPGPVMTASAVQVRRPLYSASVGRADRFGEGLAPMRQVLAAAGLISREQLQGLPRHRSLV